MLLNAEQREVVFNYNGFMLVLAGAGAGKTATISYRISNIIDCHSAKPENILLITFTNKAAGEIKERIKKIMGEDAEGITACTFHTFCSNFLRKHASVIGMTPDFTVIDSPDSMELMDVVRSEYVKERFDKNKPDDFPNKRIISYIYSASVNKIKTYSDIISDEYGDTVNRYESDILIILKRYKEYKIEHKLMDYDDLLFYTHKILSENEKIRSLTDEHYKYIACDEYQDTNLIQDAILDLITQDVQNLVVVGDDNQSIYKFRGAEIENILTFTKRHPGCKKVILTENYRSSQEILDFSNAFMKYATEGMPKELRGQFHGNKPKALRTYSQRDESIDIYKRIESLHTSGVKYSDIAVLIRNSFMSNQLEILLSQAGIPFNKFGGMKFLEKEAVKDIIGFLRAHTNNKDEIAFFRILKKYPGIGNTYAKKIAEKVSSDGLDKISTLYPKREFNQYLKEFEEFMKKLDSKNLQDKIKAIISDYYPKVVKRFIDESKNKDKDEYYDKIFEQIKESEILLELSKKYKSARSFLDDLVLEVSTPDDESDAINISTIHSAKGLEYDYVFIMDLVDGFFPRESNDKEKAEELRCLYVAATRAKKELYFYIPENVFYNGRVSPAKPSEFIYKKDVLKQCEIVYIYY